LRAGLEEAFWLFGGCCAAVVCVNGLLEDLVEVGGVMDDTFCRGVSLWARRATTRLDFVCVRTRTNRGLRYIHRGIPGAILTNQALFVYIYM
jgi:hypothetical protein